jgi:enolase-phosphatase E1
VPSVLQRWKDRDLLLAVYSSGSVDAQKDIFQYSDQGDLKVYFKHFFDTGVGPKREADSYANILSKLQLSGPECLFLSDVGAELDAARAHGIQTLQLLRPGITSDGKHPTANDFEDVDRWLQAR